MGNVGLSDAGAGGRRLIAGVIDVGVVVAYIVVLAGVSFVVRSALSLEATRRYLKNMCGFLKHNHRLDILLRLVDLLHEEKRRLSGGTWPQRRR